ALDLRQIGPDVADPRRPRWMRAQQLDRLALVRRRHLLPERDARARVVARARRELEADQVGFALVLAAELHRQQLAAHVREESPGIAETEDGGADLDRRAGRE